MRGQRLLGDRVHDALAAVGVTPEKYRRVKRAIGLGVDCGCAGRQQLLNRAHLWLLRRK